MSGEERNSQGSCIPCRRGFYKDNSLGAAAMFGASAVSILAIYLPAENLAVANADRRAGLQSTIYFYSAITLACAVLVWLLVPHDKTSVNTRRNPFKGVKQVIGRPLIWAQAGVIICA